MHIVIEQPDFRRLSAETQKELIEAFAGKALGVAQPAKKQGKALGVAQPTKKQGKALWREPMDLSSDLAVRLLHGLSEPHRVRLRLFAQKGGRVTQRELLRATGDEDLRALSHFQAVLSRRLRRFLDDPEKQIHLIGWDFDATKWDKSHSTIINGVYYVTEPTARALQDYFDIKPTKGAAAR